MYRHHKKKLTLEGIGQASLGVEGWSACGVSVLGMRTKQVSNELCQPSNLALPLFLRVGGHSDDLPTDLVPPPAACMNDPWWRCLQQTHAKACSKEHTNQS